jgi:hypothetical protein
MTSVLQLLLGAALVVAGVLATAIADRVRGVRLREVTVPPAARRHREACRLHSAHEVESRDTSGADDVIAALIAAGFKKSMAREATRSCNDAERVTVEDWTCAALRRCAKGAIS